MATSLRGVRARLDGFLFTPVDARAAAWLRIAFAVALPFFFWSGGLVAYSGLPPAGLWFVEHVVLRVEYWLLVVALCTLLGLGWRSRGVCTALLLLLAPMAFLSLGRQSRQVLLLALLAFSFVRSDAVRFPWRAPERTPEAGPCWPVRLLQLNLSILYGFNAVAKSDPAYLGGDVLMAMSVVHPNFRMDLSGGMLDLGLFSVSVAVAAVLSALTEYTLALGFWVRRWRWAVASIGVGFHVALMFVVRILHLDLAAMFLYLAFLLPLVSGGEGAARPNVPEPGSPDPPR